MFNHNQICLELVAAASNSVEPADINKLIDNTVWAIRSTYHKVLKASPYAAIFGRDMLFDIPFVADWKQIGDYRQHQTDRSNIRENNKRVDYDYKVGDRILIHKDGILCKQSPSGEKSMDHNNSSYKWNNQDSMRNQIGKNK